MRQSYVPIRVHLRSAFGSKKRIFGAVFANISTMVRWPEIPDCTGIILAGGKAVRLRGIAKGRLRLGNKTLIERTLALFADLFPMSLIVANEASPYQHLGVPIVADQMQSKGAPGGLHAGLLQMPTEWAFVAACDMPFLRKDYIIYLADRRLNTDAVLVRWHNRFEPLHAFWARRCLAPLEALLTVGDPSFTDLVTKVKAKIITEEEWRLFDPTGAAFANANTMRHLDQFGLRLPDVL